MAIKYIGSVKDRMAADKVKEIYKELKNDMGDVVEPISLHAINPELLEGIWNILREVVVVNGKMTRIQKEAIGAAVSEANRCNYCVDAHTIMLIGLKDYATASAIVKRKPDMINDTLLRNLVKWSLDTRNFNSVIIKFPPFSSQQAPEAIGTAVFFHYLNRMVSAFLGPTILPVNINFLKGSMKKMAGKMFASTLSREKEQKIFKPKNFDNVLDRIPWTLCNPQVRHVYSQFYLTLNSLAEKYVPEEVRKFINNELNNWDGVDQFITTDKDAKLQDVSEQHQELAGVLYTQAFAPHKININDIEKLKRLFPQDTDEAILVSFAWASFQAALYIGIQVGKKFNTECAN
ncbi:MAG: carboxymuconolactone decarboxylase family protein [Bacteroidota bacterium]